MLAMSCGGHSNAPTQPTSPPRPDPLRSRSPTCASAPPATPHPASHPDKRCSCSPRRRAQTARVPTSRTWQSGSRRTRWWRRCRRPASSPPPSRGTLDVTATYSGKSGSLHADVQKPGCAVTLSPESTVFGALTSNATVAVTTTLSTCRWKARSDAPWLSFQFDPNRSGNGSFTYSVPGNNNTIVHADNRAGRLPVADQRHRLRALYAGTNQRHGIGDDPVCGHARVVLLDTRSHD